MNRPSSLIYTEDRTDLRSSQSLDGEQLFTCKEGVPFLWILAFGGRNIWNPGDDVHARGGVVGKRNPYETQVEVALARLERAEEALRHEPYLWPWLSAMPILQRKLGLKQNTAFLRIVAPWLMGLTDAQIERWRSATAFAENGVNFFASNRRAEGVAAWKELRPFCPFVPLSDGTDRDVLKHCKSHPAEPEASRIALLTLGDPDNRDVFDRGVQRDVVPAMETFAALPPPPKIAPVAAKVASDAGAKPDPSAGTESLFGRLAGIFRKK